ncbi:hypothetical protein GCM10027051_19930 [Niabella terrae]
MKVVLIIICLIVSGGLQAQSRAGITGKRDSSYNTASAFAKDRRYHPQIRIANLEVGPAVKSIKDLIYCSRGNRRLQTDVFYPAAHGNHMALIFVHGGGWRSGNRQQHHALAAALARRGYTVFTPEYRLSTEALFPAAVLDLKAMVRWVRSQSAVYGLDSNCIAIGGFSAGGELAAFLGVTNHLAEFEGRDCLPELSATVNAVLDIDGTLSFVHPESGEGDDRKGPSAATRWFGYSKKENPELWERASPLHYADKQAVPTLFLNSSVARMHAGRDDYRKILQQAGIYTEVHEFADSPHSFCLYHPWFEPTVNYMDRFLQRVFKKK